MTLNLEQAQARYAAEGGTEQAVRIDAAYSERWLMADDKKVLANWKERDGEVIDFKIVKQRETEPVVQPQPRVRRRDRKHNYPMLAATTAMYGPAGGLGYSIGHSAFRLLRKLSS